ncbi:uncharacterized protein CLUP02_00266 [Colletotrichum lupini]|uniref:Uncharacterized protein n=1 Tax=Colletotrichum lupini TaxID=145971 RepID=A0A9Q8S9V1_9PEZI|nr:uncharacterized protein CLUP02_00266 [Colletotrichum lupini]UQC73621.1 hypothetical protein CLUP02_00266 [Colletotrichum lupini]
MPLAVVAREARPCTHACITKPSPSQECTTAHKHAFPLSLFPFLPQPLPCLSTMQQSSGPCNNLIQNMVKT